MIRLLVLPLLAALAGPVAAESMLAPYREGEHYATLPVPVATGEDEVVVTEFFSYACVHCFQFDGELDAWAEQAPADVTLERVPAVFSRQWVLYAEAYYVARACDVLDTTHDAFFRAIHVDRQRFSSREDVAAFYADQVTDDAGCSSEAEFMDAFRSFGVRASMQQAMARGRAYQASGVPTMIVDGKWRTDGRSAGSNERMLDVVDHLVRRARAADDADAPAEGTGAGS